MNPEPQPDPLRNLAQNIGLGLAEIVRFFLKIIFGAINIITHSTTILIVLILTFFAGFGFSLAFNDIDQGILIFLGVAIIVVYAALHFLFIPENYNMPDAYGFLNEFKYNCVAMMVIINLMTFAFGVFTCNHASWMKNDDIALVVDDKPIADEGWKFINPFKQKVQRIGRDLSLTDILVKGVTKDGIQIQALVDIKLRRNDNPEHWKSPTRLNPGIGEIISKRFITACSNVTSGEIALSGLKLEFDTGRDTLPEQTLPKAVQRNGEVVVKNIHARFMD